MKFLGLKPDNFTYPFVFILCGNLLAYEHEIEVRDLVSWNSMISGYSKMGFASDVVELFNEMRDEEVVPDEMTL